ncbi:MAG: Gfo/Idh/MocA family oxidoreductase [Oscillospiraceae bacterium]|nr:Gfo/Idh/MocA family oxidoreductase [Oscillospiraceae bacterium]
MKKQKVKTVMVGVGGYGASYLNYFEEGVLDWDMISLEGIVDPYAEKSHYYDMLKSRKIPVFTELSDFYREKDAQLAIISTPIYLHRSQCETALSNGSDVLCEKPLVCRLSDWEAIRQVEISSGKRVGVGFQWSFSQTMLSLKKDILSGIFGKPVRLKTLVCTTREDNYYRDSSWKGRLYDKNGNYVNDSIMANATAHYLHNIFFLMGQSIETSLLPEQITPELYRAKEIETYDTCFLKGVFSNQAETEFYYAVSHACTILKPPVFTYEFENAVIGLNDITNDSLVHARFPDGTEKIYGSPFTMEEESRKLKAMLDYITDGSVISCGAETVYPHVYMCDALSQIPVVNFPEDIKIKNSKGVFCPTLDSALYSCYEKTLLPSEFDKFDPAFSWAAKPKSLKIAAK